jgi:type II secretory pathway pseudopilin PulG
MISATGNSRQAGFTIVEILLVLLLIVGISSLFVANIDYVFRQQEETTVENAFWDASREARLHAQLNRRPVTLYYDREQGAFVMQSGGAPIRSFPAITETRDGRRIEVDFVQERSRNEMVLIRGQLIDSRPIEQVVFYPDGTSTQFWIELAVGADRRQIRIDPWTGAEMLVQER